MTDTPKTTLERFASEARGMTEEEFLARHPHPFLVVGRFEEDESRAFGTVTPEDGLSRGQLERLASADEAFPGGEEYVYPLVKSDRNTFERLVTVGRSTNNDIVISHSSVSKLHAYFRHEGDHHSITDAGSSNGTFIEEFPLPENKPVKIESRQAIRFGKHIVATFYAGADLYRRLRKA